MIRQPERLFHVVIIWLKYYGYYSHKHDSSHFISSLDLSDIKLNSNRKMCVLAQKTGKHEYDTTVPLDTEVWRINMLLASDVPAPSQACRSLFCDLRDR